MPTYRLKVGSSIDVDRESSRHDRSYGSLNDKGPLSSQNVRRRDVDRPINFVGRRKVLASKVGSWRIDHWSDRIVVEKTNHEIR